MITTLLLDLGGTLVFPNFARIAAELADDDVVVAPDVLSAREPHGRWAIDRADLIARTNDASRWDDYFHEIMRACGFPAMPAGALGRLRAYHDAHNLWEFVPDDIPPVLTQLRQKYRLGVISNANGTLHKKLQELGLADAFDIVVDSGVEGVEKPDPRLFHIALDRLGARASEAAYVGDLYHVDVLGARAAGIEAILIDQAGLHRDKDCRRIRSLRDLC